MHWEEFFHKKIAHLNFEIFCRKKTKMQWGVQCKTNDQANSHITKVMINLRNNPTESLLVFTFLRHKTFLLSYTQLSSFEINSEKLTTNVTTIKRNQKVSDWKRLEVNHWQFWQTYTRSSFKTSLAICLADLEHQNMFNTNCHCVCHVSQKTLKTFTKDVHGCTRIT